MKDKTKRLQRWLDRMAAACECHKWKSAVAEADCLSAELRQLRDELWNQAESEAVSREPLALRLRNFAFTGAKSFGVAVAIVCAMTIPIAVESGTPSQSASAVATQEPRYDRFALVTTEEEELLELLRKNLNESNAAVKMAGERLPSTQKNLSAKARTKPAPASVAAPASTKSETEKLKAEDLLTLIQIGEQSLRGGESAIKIVD